MSATSGGVFEPGRPADRIRVPEERFERLRREAATSGRIERAGVRAAGGPLPATLAAPGYHGRRALKPPVWTWEVPAYFFTGGLAGMSAVLALGVALAGGADALLLATLWFATVGAALSAALLILDLGRPVRFLYMLRLFKWRSPMSVGSWLLTLFGGAATGALVLAHLAGADAGWARALLLVFLVPAALLGSVVATYTGVLVGATAVPAWAQHRRLLPLHFGVAGLGSAAGLTLLAGFETPALGWILVGASAVETAIGAWIELVRHGARDRALRAGGAAVLLRLGGVLAGPLALVLALAGLHLVAAVLFLAGALVTRFGWLAAGRRSAEDAVAALAHQSE
jgi:hypothetical protein